MSHPLLAAYGVTFGYRAGGDPVLREISLELARGEILSLIGPNGSGKSTLLKVLSGILPLSRSHGGIVKIGGTEIFSLAAAERARHVAYVGPEIRAEFPLTALETVGMGSICAEPSAGARAADRAQWAMELAQCWSLRARDLHTLSGGEKQRVALARALAQGAKTILLDEALSKMDLDHQALAGKLLRKLASEGYGVILVSHDLNVASEWADRCLLLRRGAAIALGPTREVLTAERIRALYPAAELVVGASPASGAPKIFFGG